MELFGMMIGCSVEDLIEELQAHEEVKGWGYDDEYEDELNVELIDGLCLTVLIDDNGIVDDIIEYYKISNF